MTEQSDRAWFVVQTQVNSEAKAERNLLQQGFDVYLPRYLKLRSHARKIDKVPAPLFPRYMFVQVDIAKQRWRSIQSTLGVSHMVFNGSRPASVADNIIETLKAREDERGMIKLGRPAHIAVGERVRILAGSFVGSLGFFEGMADRDRVAILLDFLGRKVRVSLDMDLVATT